MRAALLVASFIVFAITGCTASGPTLSESRDAVPALATNNGRIWFYRVDSFVGSALVPTIRLNGERIGYSVPGGVFFHDAPPGKYTVTTATEVSYDLTFDLEAGQERFVKTAVEMGVLVGRVRPVLDYPDNARSQISRLVYLPDGGEAFAQAANPQDTMHQ